MIVCSFVHKEATFVFLLIIIMFCILVSYIINDFIFLFIYFYTGPILIAVFITEMVILFKHVNIIVIILSSSNWTILETGISLPSLVTFTKK